MTEKSAWDAIARRFFETSDPGQTTTVLIRISKRLDREDLLIRALQTARIGADPDKIFSFTRDLVDRSMSAGEFTQTMTALHFLTKALVGTGKADRIIDLFEHAKSVVADDMHNLADLEAWLGECMKILRQPQQFLERVGLKPRDWEHRLALEQLLTLWNERANALRLVGKTQEALGITDDLLRKIEGQDGYDENRYVLLRNRGILLRELGALDE